MTTPEQNEPEENSDEGVIPIPQISNIGASPSDGLVSYPGHALEVALPFTEMQSAYSLSRDD